MNEFKNESSKKGENHESHACNLMNVRSYKEKKKRSFTFSDDKNSLLVISPQQVHHADLLREYKLLIRLKIWR